MKSFPDSVDPWQLHNNVPSINVLIQLCIDHHEFIIGPEEEEGMPDEEKPSEEGISPEVLNLHPLLCQSLPLFWIDEVFFVIKRIV